MSILLFFIILIVLVIVHELGHFVVAKISGIEVKEFGLGFPPRVWGKKLGGTFYSLNWIPFGGFVKIFGENPEELPATEEDKKKNFSFKPRPIQALVLVAGVAFNVIFAWFLISFGFMTGLPSSVGASTSGQVSNPEVIITEIVQNSPAQKAGLHAGDKIISLEAGSEKIAHPTISGVQDFIESHGEEKVKVGYKRGEENKIIALAPKTGIVEGKSAIGVSMDMVGILKLPFFQAFYEGGKLTFFVTKNVAAGLGTFIWDAITLKARFSQVTGPVGIVSLVGSAAELGVVYLLSLSAFISLNLAVINLIPFPALDGGRLLFVLIESIKRTPIKPKIANIINGIGFFMLLALMAVVTLHDIIKLF